jgi:hypothetical protein
VHGHDRVPGGEQALDDQAAAAFDDDRQRGGLPEACQPPQRCDEVLLGVTERPAVHDRAGVVQHGHVVGGAGPVPADEHLGLPVGSLGWLPRLLEALSPVLHCSALDGAGP